MNGATTAIPRPPAAVPARESFQTTRLGQKRRRDNDGSGIGRPRSPKSPVDLVYKEIMNLEVDSDGCLVSEPSLSFLKPTDEMVAAYKMEVVAALRTEKVEELKKLHESGEVLQCCNRFGESLLHMACRRGLTEVVKFLVREAEVSLLVMDDFGRTALHFALWTATPSFDLVEFIVEQVPALLCIKDVRGHLPLQYARKEDWGAWCDFFQARKHLLLPNDPSQSASPTASEE